MTRQGEATAHYHRLLESGSNGNLDWADEIQDRMAAANLMEGTRPICPFLRPHFLSRRQYAVLAKAAETLCSAIERLEQMALASPALLARLHLLPAEKMLASADPGYPYIAVAALLDTQLNGAALQFVGYSAGTPPGVVYGSALADLFYDSPVVKQFRRQYNLAKLPGTKPLASSLLAAYKQFGGKLASGCWTSARRSRPRSPATACFYGINWQPAVWRRRSSFRTSWSTKAAGYGRRGT
jgi:hypothetical protein